MQQYAQQQNVPQQQAQAFYDWPWPPDNNSPSLSTNNNINSNCTNKHKGVGVVVAEDVANTRVVEMRNTDNKHHARRNQNIIVGATECVAMPDRDADPICRGTSSRRHSKTVWMASRAVVNVSVDDGVRPCLLWKIK